MKYRTHGKIFSGAKQGPKVDSFLARAVRLNEFEVIARLLELGADVNKKDVKGTPADKKPAEKKQ